MHLDGSAHVWISSIICLLSALLIVPNRFNARQHRSNRRIDFPLLACLSVDVVNLDREHRCNCE